MKILDAAIDKMLMWNINGHTEPVVFQPEMKAAIKKLITTREQQVATEARIDEREHTKLPFTGDHSECPDKRTCIGYQNAESDLYNENLIRIAELKAPKEVEDDQDTRKI